MVSGKKSEAKGCPNSESSPELGLESSILREHIHTMSNALFVLKGTLPDLEQDVAKCMVRAQEFKRADFEKKMSILLRNVDKIDQSLNQLRLLAKQMDAGQESSPT